jgi:dCMP deaminase
MDSYEQYREANMHGHTDTAAHRVIKWHHRFLALARHVEQWSKDPSMKVGAVIVATDRRVLALGYNGFPRGVADMDIRYQDRTLKYPMVVHAEVNAIVSAGHDLRGATLYCSTGVPCPDCMGVIIQAGIQTVVYPPQRQPNSKPGKTDWEELGKLSVTMAREAGLKLQLINAEA